jgi:hypothetical protein
MSLFVQGILFVCGIVAGICMIGWWLKSEEMEEMQMMRPPISDWGQE